MTCPGDHDWTMLSMNLLEPSQVSELNEHLPGCPACRDRFRQARRQQAALVRTYETLDRNHDELREQLMASLPAEAPPPAAAGRAPRRWRRLGESVMNNPKVRFATAGLAAAACIVLLFTLLPGSGGGLALAEIGQALRQTRSMVCHLTVDITGGPFEQSFEGKSYISARYGSRTDVFRNGQPIMTSINPVDGPIVTGCPGAPLNIRISFDDKDAFDPASVHPEAYIRRLQELTGEAERELGFDVIDGRDVLGFEVAAEKLGLAPAPPAGPDDEPTTPALLELWVDAETRLPVRYSIHMPIALPGAEMTVLCDAFEWDVPLDAALFDTAPLQGDSEPALDLKVPRATEQALIEGLTVYTELMPGSYPTALDFTRVGMDFYNKAETTPPEERRQWGEGKNLLHRMMPLFAGTRFYQQLLRDGAEPEYFGHQVTPGDADAVLLRWRLETGEYRVIYGDLHAETLPVAGQ